MLTLLCNALIAGSIVMLCWPIAALVVPGFWKSNRRLARPALFFLSASAVDLDGRQEDVWEMEEAYWRHAFSGDVEAYVSPRHDDFVGWPRFSWKPVGKDHIGSWVAETRDNDRTLAYDLRPEAVQLFDEDVAVVHYAAEYVVGYPDGTSKGIGY